ncbi:Lycopene epsilon cyclase [Hibiscus syriacus]|uniref:Lycopene epsilon cyclase n=1 Tax=Hibiscus syriacus TaxID=106335 RepID=A0A6A2YT85_HIBSY|nr:Lycopene epsilon cyclase [Hibiscus syriacus]
MVIILWLVNTIVLFHAGAASGKLLQYEVGVPRVSIQTAYGIEVEVENNPYDPSLMVFMDYRDYAKQEVPALEAQYPTFLYAMPMSSTRVFIEKVDLQETCLASKDAMPFDLLKKKLIKEWSYIPVGGSLPNTKQKNLAFGAAASMVHPATVAELSLRVLRIFIVCCSALSWNTLWPLERKRQRSFFLFGLALILQLDIEGIRTFFRLPSWMWQGFLGSTLSSADLVLFAFYMFFIAPNDMRMSLVKHLMSDPTGATMIRTYFTI